MAKLHLGFLSFALTACGSSNNSTIDAKLAIDASSGVDAKVFLDGPPDAPPVYDFTCLNVAPPTTAADPVIVSGTAQEIDLAGITPSVTPLVNQVLACKGTCAGTNRLATATSDSQGAYSLVGIPTANLALDGYVKIAKANDRTTLAFPYNPIVADLANVPLLVFTNTAFTAVITLAGATEDVAKGALGLAVVDCANNPITDTAHITLSIKQGGTDVAGTTTTDLGTLSAQAKGTFLIFNVPANATTEVNASYMGTTLTTFRPHNVRVDVASTTETILRPGYSP